MIYQTSPTRMRSGRGFGGLSGGAPPPKDLIAILVSLFITFSLQFFATTALVPWLFRLTPAVFKGFVWQIVTYPFVGWGASWIWFLLGLYILFIFGRDVFWRLGRQRFWLMVLRGTLGAAIVAIAVQFVLQLAEIGATGFAAFFVMQGQHILMVIVIAAFATLWGEATILLFFVLPIRARWFLPLEILFAFIGFLQSHDFSGFCGVCAAVFLTYSGLKPGGPKQVLHGWKKRFERFVIQQRLNRLKKKRKFDVIDGDGDKDRWVH